MTFYRAENQVEKLQTKKREKRETAGRKFRNSRFSRYNKGKQELRQNHKASENLKVEKENNELGLQLVVSWMIYNDMLFWVVKNRQHIS